MIGAQTGTMTASYSRNRLQQPYIEELHMDTRARGANWVMFSAIVLFVAGVFAVIDGLVAVYKSTFFTQNAVYVFSDLRTWGWIVFGLGVAGVAAGLAVFSGREWARWTGIIVAGLGAAGQLLFAQAYPLWSLMIMGLNVLVIYGLAAYGGRDYAAGESSGYYESVESRSSEGSGSASSETSQDRRAA
jgi:hypothetical protein